MTSPDKRETISLRLYLSAFFFLPFICLMKCKHFAMVHKCSIMESSNKKPWGRALKVMKRSHPCSGERVEKRRRRKRKKKEKKLFVLDSCVKRSQWGENERKNLHEVEALWQTNLFKNEKVFLTASLLSLSASSVYVFIQRSPKFDYQTVLWHHYWHWIEILFFIICDTERYKNTK